jgi:hypothetical protein
MRFVLVSTHTDQTTGYSKVAFNLLKQISTLAPRVKLFHFGFQRHPNSPGFRKLPAGIVQYDAAANEDPKEEGFGINKINEYLDMVQPDVVMIYNDPLIIYRFIEAMKHQPGTSPYKLWTYVDQVYDGIAQPLVDKINTHSDRIYCFTDIWKKKYLEYGIANDVRVLEHAVDSGTFSRLAQSAKTALRSSMNIPQEAIVFLNANRNSQRKRLDLTIQGFVGLVAASPLKPYYLLIATGVNPQSGSYYDVARIYNTELIKAGLTDRIFQARMMVVDTSPPNVIGDDGINQLYNVADVGINTSDGEGFGLCQLEHMLTGAPQIVTDVGSYRSFLSKDVAEFVPAGAPVYFAGSMPLGGYAPGFDPKAVTRAMESVIEKLPQMRDSVSAYSFKTWSGVCDEFLEDLLSG